MSAGELAVHAVVGFVDDDNPESAQLLIDYCSDDPDSVLRDRYRGTIDATKPIRDVVVGIGLQALELNGIKLVKERKDFRIEGSHLSSSMSLVDTIDHILKVDTRRKVFTDTLSVLFGQDEPPEESRGDMIRQIAIVRKQLMEHIHLSSGLNRSHDDNTVRSRKVLELFLKNNADYTKTRSLRPMSQAKRIMKSENPFASEETIQEYIEQCLAHALELLYVKTDVGD